MNRMGSVAIGLLAYAASLAWMSHGLPTTPGRHTDPVGEVARIRRHLAGAEATMRARDLGTLSAAQRSARARRMADLHAYRERGVFPHNHVMSRRTPVFVDGHGTRCAMAYLIERTGGEALVARVAANRNLARVRELAGDPELVAWLDRNGITAAEAARIQPEYAPTLDDEANGLAWAAGIVGAGAGTAGLALNLAVADQPGARSRRGVAGVALGLIGAGLGAATFADDGAVRTLGAMDVALGLASFGFGIRQLNAAPGSGAPRAAMTLAPAVWRRTGEAPLLGVAARF